MFLTAALMLAFFTIMRAQSHLLTNPANLSQFPSVEKIRIATKGTDDVDTHARFIIALWRINGMMVRDLLMDPNGEMHTLPAAAAPIQEQYRQALSRYNTDEAPPAARDPRYRSLEQKYEKDPVFFDDLLTKFFSPKFRIDYYAWVKKTVPQTTAVAGATGPTASSPTDPSIDKANAAKIDIRIFGLELGQPIRLPFCRSTILNQVTEPSCVIDPSAGTGSTIVDQVLTSIPGMSNADAKVDPNFREINFGPERCPAWVALNCRAEAYLYNGRLVSLTINTKGRSVEKAVNEALREKYGPPTRVALGKITPDVGNAFETRDPEWILPGIRVEYQLVYHQIVNSEEVVNTNVGWLRIITESAFQRLNNAPSKIKI